MIPTFVSGGTPVEQEHFTNRRRSVEGMAARRAHRDKGSSFFFAGLCRKPAPVFSGRAAAVWLTAALVAFGAGLASRTARAAPPQSGVPARARVVELRIGDEIDPIMAEYVDGGIAQAAQERASLVLITMDTPGGLEDSMQDIIQHILSSPVPVAVYISPTGSRGASAGFFILLSADIAAMAPGTHTGAASPIMAVGGMPLTMDPTLAKKIMNDATAFLRSYTVKRGRNPTLAETAVTDAKSFTDAEALDGKLIDLVANSPDDLLARLDGRTITRFDGTTTQLSLRDPERVAVEMSARERFLARIVQPDAFFILLIVGVLGLYTEFTHPGAVAPGVIGGIAAVLALFAMHILPVNFAGLLLIFAALAMFALEAKYTSHGVLAIGGVLSMLLGALLLIRSPLTGAGVSLGVALGVTAPAAALTIFLMRLVLRSRGWKQSTGKEQLVGAPGEVTEALGAKSDDGSFVGMVLMRGELWRAAAREPIPAGAIVRVVRIRGLTAEVEAAESPAASGAPAARVT
jgi:membrane-bound serine protease (ClpP class)